MKQTTMKNFMKLCDLTVVLKMKGFSKVKQGKLECLVRKSLKTDTCTNTNTQFNYQI